ncbi:MAG: alcohol dehydrogenase catalytic domain-containing protein [Sporolactobacillus sp.]|jgi:ribitol-5-phosphate 2-dehydrogenase|nr:alcohol dehydrogenase catalytic domain-containing protein [Sporolactobacillus sp.]
MINQVYRLIRPRQVTVEYSDLSLADAQVVVRPTYCSICAADHRYYFGKRDKEVLRKKLPMALIHEAMGKVVFDSTDTFKIGQNVVLIPNDPQEKSDIIDENYLRSSRFHSSSCDGFMQDYVFSRPDRLVAIPETIDPTIAAFTELMSVSMQAIKQFKRRALYPPKTVGVWGDGNVGYITALFLKETFKDAKIYLFSKHSEKAEHFSFADETFYIDHVPADLTIDHAFECVGGAGSESALAQIIDHIQPMGTVMAMGVSEYPVPVNTRMILEKGLSLIGTSRSGRDDFVHTVEFLKDHPEVRDYMTSLVGDVKTIHCLADIDTVFEQDLSSFWGKTIIKWEI